MWHRLAERGWRNALIELLLIVVGVLLALAASGWQERRSQRDVERAVLGEIGEALSGDLDQIQADLDRFRRVEASTELL
jgi:type II secretory pathway pseudopilin PulG